MDFKTQHKSHNKLVIICVITVLGMFGFCYALVPLYDVFCDITGLQGKTGSSRVRANTLDNIDTTRVITVEFVAHVGGNLQGDFYPESKKIQVHPGQLNKVIFYAINSTNDTVITQSVPSISPGIASPHFEKTECFCFEEQTLKAGEKVAMPLVFFVDKDIPNGIPRLTLSYTIYKKI